MPFFTFGQNNSGGSFVTNDSVAEYVIVEADNADAANSIANDIGIYFNGVKDGIDCDCCGDRWYRVDDRDADQEPNIYGKHPAEQKYHCFVYYSTGFVDEFNHPVKHVRAAEQTAIGRSTILGIESKD
jgi:hypothetical protein